MANLHANDPHTSRQAWAKAKPTAANTREQAMEVFRTFPEGLTADEVGELLDVRPTSIRQRVTELFQHGRVEYAGIDRPSSTSGADMRVMKIAAPVMVN